MNKYICRKTKRKRKCNSLKKIGQEKDEIQLDDVKFSDVDWYKVCSCVHARKTYNGQKDGPSCSSSLWLTVGLASRKKGYYNLNMTSCRIQSAVHKLHSQRGPRVRLPSGSYS